MDADDRALLLLIEKQLVATRCTVETALSLIGGLVATEPTEPPAEAAPAAPPLPPERPSVFGGGAAGEPRMPPVGPNGILGG